MLTEKDIWCAVLFSSRFVVDYVNGKPRFGTVDQSIEPATAVTAHGVGCFSLSCFTCCIHWYYYSCLSIHVYILYSVCYSSPPCSYELLLLLYT